MSAGHGRGVHLVDVLDVVLPAGKMQLISGVHCVPSSWLKVTQSWCVCVCVCVTERATKEEHSHILEVDDLDGDFSFGLSVHPGRIQMLSSVGC